MQNKQPQQSKVTCHLHQTAFMPITPWFLVKQPGARSVPTLAIRKRVQFQVHRLLICADTSLPSPCGCSSERSLPLLSLFSSPLSLIPLGGAPAWLTRQGRDPPLGWWGSPPSAHSRCSGLDSARPLGCPAPSSPALPAPPTSSGPAPPLRTHSTAPLLHSLRPHFSEAPCRLPAPAEPFGNAARAQGLCPSAPIHCAARSPGLCPSLLDSGLNWPTHSHLP